MKTTLWRTMALLCLLTLWHGSAGATERSEPLYLNLLGTPRSAEDGVPYDGVLHLTVSKAAAISSISLTGAGWSTRLEGAPAALNLDPSGSLDIPFSATPNDATIPLVLRLLIDGQEWSREIDLSPGAIERMLPGVMAAQDAPGHPVTPGATMPTLDERIASSRVELDGVQIIQPRVDAKSPEAMPTGTLHLTGQVGYIHPNGQFVPAPNTWVWVMYDTWSGPFDPTYTGFPFRAAMERTDAQGNFDVFITWPPPKTHNKVWVETVAANSDAVINHVSYWDSTWRFSSPVYTDQTVGAIQYGQLSPAKENRQAAFHILNTIALGREYMTSLQYPNVSVEIQWPESGDTSYYDGNTHEIHMTGTSEFSEATILHEWGHRWMAKYASTYSHDYCNSMCDTDDCGHCIWCPEDLIIAWKEGFPNFLSELMTDYIRRTYTWPGPMIVYDFESIRADGNCLGNVDALNTEGYLAAALHDLVDANSTPEDDPYFPGWTDQLQDLLPEILTNATTAMPDGLGFKPRLSTEFFESFMTRHPEIKNDLWETFMNNGVDLDVEPPPIPGGLASSSHVIGVESPDNTVVVSWTQPEDDASGISGYSYRFTQGAPAAPLFFQNTGPFSSLISSPLPAGSWYCSVRALDRSGKWSGGYASIGPFVIRTPDPANLAYEERAGWPYPLVPRNATVTGISSVPITSVLNGGTAATFWNVAGVNSGEELTSSSSVVGLTLDGNEISSQEFPGLGAGSSATVTNQGPIIIPGGRHTLGMVLDKNEVLAESDENDNHWARQWVWRPLSLTDDTIESFPAPPERNGGFNHIKSGSIANWNCNGHLVPWSIPVTAVWAYGEGAQTDYDLTLYNSTATPDAGFDVAQAASSRGSGLTDAVLIHGPNDGFQDHNVGVTNMSSSATNYRIEKVVSSYIQPGDSDLLWMGNNDMFSLRTISIPAGQDGNVTLTLYSNPDSQPLYMAYFGPGFATAGLLDAEQTVMAADGSRASIQVNVPSGQYGAVAVYRDPKDGVQYLNFTLACSQTLPDLAAATPANWYGAFVPRGAKDQIYPFNNVPTPTVLPGDTSSTYFYVSEFNQSPSASGASSFDLDLRLDGAPLASYTRSTLAGFEERHFVTGSASTIPAGRHTVSMSLDVGNTVVEEVETNNAYGQQWVWAGPLLNLGTPRTVASPSLRTAGFDDITQGLAFYNCYGLSLPSFGPTTGLWGGVYLVGDPTVDLDLRIHNPVIGTLNRYTLSKAASAWSGTDCDFVLVNFQRTAYQGYDVSVVNIAGSGSGVVQAVGSTDLGPVFNSPFGPFTLAPGTGMALHDIVLYPGGYTLALNPAGGESGRLGVSIYGSVDAYYNKAEPTYDAISWNFSPGSSESLLVSIPDYGSYCVAVWKVDQDELGKTLAYTIDIVETPTSVGGSLPTPNQARFVSVQPNPVHPSATIVFEIPRSERALVDVFNVRGEHIRQLLDDERPAGRHEIRWDGRDSDGAEVASGIYFARLKAGDHEGRIKMTLVR